MSTMRMEVVAAIIAVQLFVIIVAMLACEAIQSWARRPVL